VPAGFTRYGATITDSATGAAVVGACVYTGPPAGCPQRGANQTDASGIFAVDLPSGSNWQFTVEHPSYSAIIQATINSGTSNSLKMNHK
jgi:hypothetical protein